MNIKKKYLYKSTFRLIETDEIDNKSNKEYRIALDINTFNELVEKAKEFEEIKDSLQKIEQRSSNDKEIIDKLEDEVKKLNNELKVTRTKNDFEIVEKQISVLIKGLKDFKSKNKNNTLKLDEIIEMLDTLQLDKAANRIINLLNYLYSLMLKHFRVKSELVKEIEKYNDKIKILSDKNNKFREEKFLAERKVENFKQVIDRKQRNIDKLKLEKEKLRNKNKRQQFKDISIGYEGDSLYAVSKTYNLKNINPKNYKEISIFELPLSSDRSKEEVIKYIENCEVTNSKLYELKNEYGTELWKIQIKGKCWQVIVVQK